MPLEGIATENNIYNHFYKIPFQNLPTETSTTLDYRDNIDAIASAKHDYGINYLLIEINSIEARFHNAQCRTKRYYSKGKKRKTILTLLGEVTFERTCYQDRTNGKCFFYVDLCLKLEKYKSMDSYLEAMLLEECSITSMSAAGRNIAKLISRDVNNPNITISRQTVRNIVLKSEMHYEHKEVETPKVLNIMLDD